MPGDPDASRYLAEQHDLNTGTSYPEGKMGEEGTIPYQSAQNGGVDVDWPYKSEPKGCPDGQYWNSVTNTCEKENTGTSQLPVEEPQKSPQSVDNGPFGNDNPCTDDEYWDGSFCRLAK